jgi:hypothetical protein
VIVSDVALVGVPAGAYLAGIPLHGSPGTPLPSPMPLLRLLSIPRASHPIWMGRRGFRRSWMGVGCVASAPVSAIV